MFLKKGRKSTRATSTKVSEQLYANLKWKAIHTEHEDKLEKYGDELEHLHGEKMDTIYRLYQALTPQQREQLVRPVIEGTCQKTEEEHLCTPATALFPELNLEYVQRNGWMVCQLAMLLLADVACRNS